MLFYKEEKTLKGHNYNFCPLSGDPKVDYDKFVQFVLKYNYCIYENNLN